MTILRAALGLTFFCLVAWLMSSHRRRFPWRVVTFGILLQFALGWLILDTSGGRVFFERIADAVRRLISLTRPGTELVFGDLAKADGPVGFVLAFAGTGLPVIVFFSALMAVLYHLGIMQVVIWGLARVMNITMGTSGAESLAMAANVFVGNTEAPLAVRPYLARMTTSELSALMTGGFATIAGSVLAVYMGILGDEYGPHLLTASVMSAPAAFLIAKIMQPETEKSDTAGKVELRIDRTSGNLIEAAARGTQDGLKLWFNVIAMLIAFLGLIALVDWPLGAFGDWIGVQGGLTLARLFGWVLAPVAWLMGVEGWHDSQLFGSLMGIKVAVSDFVAISNLQTMLPEAEGAVVFQSPRAAKMAAYALCGFAHFGSIGIQIGGLSPLVPERMPEVSRLALRCMIGGAFASWSTATVAGVFL